MSDGNEAYASAELGTALRGDDPGEHVRPFAGLVDDEQVLALLNYYDDILEEPVEETPVGRSILRNVATETIDAAVRHGAVAQMKNATGLTGQAGDEGDLYAAAADQLVHEGAIGLVFGPPGAGKTALTLDLARAFQVRTGGALIGNTSWDGFDEQVETDEEMLQAMGSRKGQVLAIIDEAAQDLSGFGEGNKRAERFSDSLLLVRKRESEHGRYAKRGSVLLVAQTRKKTAKSIRRVASFGIEKPSRANPDRARLLDTDGGKDNWSVAQEFQGITDTAESFPTHEPSDFRVEAVEEGGREESDEDLERREAIRTVLRAVVEQDMKKKDAAKLVDYSRHWVGDRVKEYREDGEHADLLDGDEN